MEVVFRGEVFEWRGPSPYYYVAVPDDDSAEDDADDDHPTAPAVS